MLFIFVCYDISKFNKHILNWTFTIECQVSILYCFTLTFIYKAIRLWIIQNRLHVLWRINKRSTINASQTTPVWFNQSNYWTFLLVTSWHWPSFSKWMNIRTRTQFFSNLTLTLTVILTVKDLPWLARMRSWSYSCSGNLTSVQATFVLLDALLYHLRSRWNSHDLPASVLLGFVANINGIVCTNTVSSPSIFFFDLLTYHFGTIREILFNI